MPHDMEICNNCATTQKISLGNFFFNFNITFLATCGCANDFLKMLPKFKITARSQLQNFLLVQKLENFSSEIIQILPSHSPQYGDVQVILLRFFCDSKWPPQMNFNFLRSQKLNVVNLSNFTITFPTIWRCAWDLIKVIQKF